MKMSTTIVITILSISSLFGQSNADVTSFFKNGGASMISALAHPTNEFQSASWEFNDDVVTIKVTSKDSFFGGSVVTTVSFSRQGYFFTGIRVDGDNDSVPPFTAIAIIKEMLNEYIRDYNNEQGQMISTFEKHFNKSVVNMNAYQVSIVLLSIAFYSAS